MTVHTSIQINLKVTIPNKKKKKVRHVNLKVIYVNLKVTVNMSI